MRRTDGVDTGDVDFNEVREAALVEVKHEIMDEVKPVADDDERELIREFGLLEEVLDLLGVVVVALPANALDLADLASACRGLDVLEVHLRVRGKVDNGAEIVIETLVRLERLEHLDQLDGTEDIRVLRRDLNDDLEVLTDVDPEHLLHASKRLLSREAAEVVHEPLECDVSCPSCTKTCRRTYFDRERGRVNNDALDVCKVLIKLQSLDKT